ncbi:glycosyltransferase family 4 protein [Candidatus Methanosphaera massiliense]|jgi:glycosyltransferase involved in cell wall biosynthesis|uniref:glycosyltransferase family 4 protein n=1 Tax=Methanosphaera TaxID=2316 RepID=UPI0023808BF8|nr:glycosyltransferase family 4 protein [Candidatus Methanosphaera massiliense]MDE4078005.1 glycosyltransferase family 4 protein [Candidatus Methanosphaera massiliense]
MTDRKLKIAVFHNLPSGGAKRSLYTYIDYLTQQGHTVDVYIPRTANEDYLPLAPIASNMIEYDVRPSFIREKIYSIFSYVPAIIKRVSVNNVMKTEKQIAEDINNSDYDIVYCEQDQYTMTPVILKYLKKPTVYYCQQPIRKDRILKVVNDQKEKVGIFNNPIIKPFAQYFVNYIESRDYDRDMAFAQYGENLLANSYFSHESILKQYGKNSYVSYIGVDTTMFKPLNLERDNFVLSVGTCIPPKGFDFLIKSIAHIPKDKRPELVVVGNSSDEGWVNFLKELARNKDVELDILTMISDEDLIRLYNKAKLVVYAPYLEPFGYVPLEAMACGTPVVGVKEGGVRESVKHKITGLLAPRDEKLFAEAIVKLSEDKELWNKCSVNGVKYVHSFWTLEHAGERLLNHLYRVLEKEKDD